MNPIQAHPEWMQNALCAQVGDDSELWFPLQGGDNGRSAKFICQRCPVIKECAQVALDGDEHFGIWAGVAMHAGHTARVELRAIVKGAA